MLVFDHTVAVCSRELRAPTPVTASANSCGINTHVSIGPEYDPLATTFAQILATGDRRDLPVTFPSVSVCRSPGSIRSAAITRSPSLFSIPNGPELSRSRSPPGAVKARHKARLNCSSRGGTLRMLLRIPTHTAAPKPEACAIRNLLRSETCRTGFEGLSRIE
uniref:Uncharacterized protein n=1 Tax=Anopheles melas TaxID=34690 RepID=A0A182UD67_9DIPT